MGKAKGIKKNKAPIMIPKIIGLNMKRIQFEFDYTIADGSNCILLYLR